jgi:hypothetical protein
MVGKRNRSHVGAVPKLKSVYRNAATIPAAREPRRELRE